MIKSFRQHESTDASEKVALAIAKRWRRVEAIARLGMGVTDLIISSNCWRQSINRPDRAVARMALSKDLIPSVPGPMAQQAYHAIFPRLRALSPQPLYFPGLHQPHFWSCPWDGAATEPSGGACCAFLPARTTTLDSHQRAWPLLFNSLSSQGLPARAQVDGRGDRGRDVGLEQRRHRWPVNRRRTHARTAY